jgi:diaminopropionate ammonia-lyase
MANRKSVIFVPGDTVESRIIEIEKEGAVVHKICGDYDEACAFARKASEENGWQLVQDTAWENYEEIPALIMSGYLTLFKELEDSLHVLPEPKTDIVFLQAGVGSFAGTAIWYYLNRYGKFRPGIVIVEPYESDGLFSSFKAGKRVNPDGNLHTIMAGLNCGIPSLTAWEIIKNGTDVSMKVTDDYSELAIRELYYPNKTDERIIAGESGVGGLAGFIALMTVNDLRRLRERLQISSKSSILFFNTEGATDPVNFKSIILPSGSDIPLVSQ